MSCRLNPQKLSATLSFFKAASCKIVQSFGFDDLSVYKKPFSILSFYPNHLDCPGILTKDLFFAIKQVPRRQFCFVSSWFFFFHFFWARFIVVVSICFVCNFSIVVTCPSIQLPALLFVCVLFLLFVDVLYGEPRQN